MQKATLLLLCCGLLCSWCSVSGHSGWSSFWWLQHVMDPHIESKSVMITNHQKFVLDVLLQVNKPLVNEDLIELGNRLLDDPNNYLNPTDNVLVEFFESIRKHDFLERTANYSDFNLEHAKQIFGYYKMLLLSKSWSVLVHNICFGRLHFHPIVFVHGVHMAIRDRCDTQELVIPALNEILPDIYYDPQIKSLVQNIDFHDFTDHIAIPEITNTFHVNFAPDYVLQLKVPKGHYWRPWLMQRFNWFAPQRLYTKPTTQPPPRVPYNHVETPKNLVVDYNSCDDIPDQNKIIVSETVENEHRLSNDIGLNVFWRAMWQRRQMHTLTTDATQEEQQHLRWVPRHPEHIAVQELETTTRTLEDISTEQWPATTEGTIEDIATKHTTDTTHHVHINVTEETKHTDDTATRLTPVRVEEETEHESDIQTVPPESVVADSMRAVNVEGVRRVYMNHLLDRLMDNLQKVESTADEHTHEDTKTRSVRSITLRYPNEIERHALMRQRGGEIFIQTLKELSARLTLDKYKDEAHPEQNTKSASIHDCGRKLIKIINSTLSEYHIDHHDGNKVLRIIGDILTGHLGTQHGGHVGNVLDELISELAQERHNIGFNIINTRDAIQQDIIHETVNVINEFTKDFRPYSLEDIAAADIAIQDIDVSHLVTYHELHDADLINLIEVPLLETGTHNNMEKIKNHPVMREQNLNHRPFTVAYEIVAKHEQPVVIRTWLGPAGTIADHRHHYVLLDAFVENLHVGSNIIQRHSHTIPWTTQEVSTLRNLYHQTMSGQISDNLVSATCRYPHRLLLPSGTTEGLPVQIFVVATPMTLEEKLHYQDYVQSPHKQHVCGLGIASLGLDHLPLGFPLDRHIEHIDTASLPANVFVKADILQHDPHVHNAHQHI